MLLRCCGWESWQARAGSSPRLTAWHGLRISECTELRGHCFNLDEKLLTVHDCRGQKDRTGTSPCVGNAVPAALQPQSGLRPRAPGWRPAPTWGTPFRSPQPQSRLRNLRLPAVVLVPDSSTPIGVGREGGRNPGQAQCANPGLWYAAPTGQKAGEPTSDGDVSRGSTPGFGVVPLQGGEPRESATGDPGPRVHRCVLYSREGLSGPPAVGAGSTDTMTAVSGALPE